MIKNSKKKSMYLKEMEITILMKYTPITEKSLSNWLIKILKNIDFLMQHMTRKTYFISEQLTTSSLSWKKKHHKTNLSLTGF